MTEADDNLKNRHELNSNAASGSDSFSGTSTQYPREIYDKYIDPSESFMGYGIASAVGASEKWSEPVEDLDGPEILDSPFYELLTAIDPHNYRYWIKKFNTFHRDRFNRSWSFTFFFFGPGNYLFKGIMDKSIIFLVAYFGIYLLSTAAFGWQSATAETVVSLLTWLIWTLIGVRGSHDYFQFCIKFQDNIEGAVREKKKCKTLLIAIFTLALVLSTVLTTQP